MSQSVEPVLGLRPEDLLGKSCFDMIHPEDRESVRSATARLSGIDTVSTVVFRTWRADGTLAWVESKFKLAAQPNDPAQTEFLCVIRDVTERKRMEDELTQLNRRLTQLAATDGLTGLTNRRTFDGFLRREYESCDEIAVLLFDIDNFKGYNDTYGHQAGDRCLQAVAKAIGDATSNTSGLSARYGGEEFAVVLPNTTGRRRPEGRRRHSADGSGAGHSEHGLQPRIHHHQRGRRRQKPLDASTRPRWWGKPTPRSMKPSVSAAIAASCIPRSTCNMSRANRSSTPASSRRPNGRNSIFRRKPAPDLIPPGIGSCQNESIKASVTPLQFNWSAGFWRGAPGSGDRISRRYLSDR